MHTCTRLNVWICEQTEQDMNQGFLLQILTKRNRHPPLLDDYDCWYKLLRLSNPHLYPKTDLLSIWQHEQVTDGRDGSLALKEGLGDLRQVG